MQKKKFSSPSILTKIPGPEAKKVLRTDQKFVSQSYTPILLSSRVPEGFG